MHNLQKVSENHGDNANKSGVNQCQNECNTDDDKRLQYAKLVNGRLVHDYLDLDI